MECGRIRAAVVLSLFVLTTFMVLSGLTTELLASEDDAAQSLAGLQGIAIMVMPPNPDAERNGVKVEQIAADIKPKLLKAGIKVLTDREMSKPGFPYLNVEVNVTKDKKPDLYSYNVKVAMYKQNILNPEDAEENIGFALYDADVIWSSEQNGTAPGSDLKNNVKKQVDDAVEKFITAYLAANPKEGR